MDSNGVEAPDSLVSSPALSLASTGESPSPRPAIVLHDGGDAILVIGSESSSQQSVVISKTAMSLASPVWKAMFERHWSEHEATEIPMLDDDIDAMLIVLRIAHLRFHEVPQKNGLSIHGLLNLAVVCDKYDLVRLVRPFLDLHGWEQCHFPDFSKKKNCSPTWFFIAWTFGYSESFELLARHITKRVGLDADGIAVVQGKEEYFPDHMPPGLLEKMLVVRTATITSMLQIIYETLDKVLEGPTCHYPTSAEACRFMILGSYVSFLIENDLYPVRRSAADISLSIRSLKYLVNSVKIRTYDEHDYKLLASTVRSRHNFSPSHPDFSNFLGKGVTSHAICAAELNLVSRINAEYQNIPSCVLTSHDAHLVEQAKK
ncbi:hypothetical protein BKA66DRAFT_223145 [Pyrenochaeta sp. MPI-SDFR-AT-0127]|nr:hypothetical protein BKA66DRAFT_223145 [Pyrenochaeta sp. MPI-SDFR-AT-0127]